MPTRLRLTGAQQFRLLAALGAWCIQGTRGHIYTDGRGWVLYVAGRSVRHWSAVRAKLATFCTVTQDGDEEGVARLHDLPAPEQAAVIREALGIRKRVAVSTGTAVAAQSAGQGFWLRVAASRRGGFGRQDR